MSRSTIVLQKASKTFRQGETITGTLEIDTVGNNEVSHEGITMHLDGHITLLRAKMSMNEKETIPLADSTIQIVKPGRLPAKAGKLSIPFSLLFEKLESDDLVDTYHGVNINIEYFLRGQVKRGLLAHNIVTPPLEIYCESVAASEACDDDPSGLMKRRTQPKEFIMTPQSVTKKTNNLATTSSQPPTTDFQIRGSLTSTAFRLGNPLTGHVCVEASDKPVKSIEIQLIRIEEIGAMPGQKLVSEVQNIQVAEGNVRTGLDIPLYMVFPRYFCCPDFAATAFKIGFEITISVVFSDNHIVADNIPIILYR